MTEARIEKARDRMADAERPAWVTPEFRGRRIFWSNRCRFCHDFAGAYADTGFCEDCEVLALRVVDEIRAARARMG
jgi:hypothetical protein